MSARRTSKSGSGRHRGVWTERSIFPSTLIRARSTNCQCCQYSWTTILSTLYVSVRPVSPVVERSCSPTTIKYFDLGNSITPTTQWAAVATHLELMTAPPQIWPPSSRLLSWAIQGYACFLVGRPPMTLEWVTVVLGTPQLHLGWLVEGVVVVGVTTQPDAIFYLILKISPRMCEVDQYIPVAKVRNPKKISINDLNIFLLNDCC